MMLMQSAPYYMSLAKRTTRLERRGPYDAHGLRSGAAI